MSLVEAVKAATRVFSEGKSREEIASVEIGEAIVTNPGVRKAIYDVMPWCMYGVNKLNPSLFNDPTPVGDATLGDLARGDYFEMASLIIEVNIRPFFPKASSKSASQGSPTTSALK